MDRIYIEPEIIVKGLTVPALVIEKNLWFYLDIEWVKLGSGWEYGNPWVMTTA